MYEDRPEPAPRVPQEGQALPGAPALGATGLLGGGHHQVPAQAKGVHEGMDADCGDYGHAALRSHGDEEPAGRHHTHRESDGAD